MSVTPIAVSMIAGFAFLIGVLIGALLVVRPLVRQVEHVNAANRELLADLERHRAEVARIKVATDVAAAARRRVEVVSAPKASTRQMVRDVLRARGVHLRPFGV